MCSDVQWSGGAPNYSESSSKERDAEQLKHVGWSEAAGRMRWRTAGWGVGGGLVGASRWGLLDGSQTRDDCADVW
jgi:hypothetical protein